MFIIDMLLSRIFNFHFKHIHHRRALYCNWRLSCFHEHLRLHFFLYLLIFCFFSSLYFTLLIALNFLLTFIYYIHY